MPYKASVTANLDEAMAEQRVKQDLNFVFMSDPAQLEQTGLGQAFRQFFNLFVMQSGGKAVEKWAVLEKLAKYPAAQDTKTIAYYTQANGNRIPLTYNSLASELLKLHPGVTSQNIGAMEKDFARQDLLRRATEPLGYARRRRGSMQHHHHMRRKSSSVAPHHHHHRHPMAQRRRSSSSRK